MPTPCLSQMEQYEHMIEHEDILAETEEVLGEQVVWKRVDDLLGICDALTKTSAGSGRIS